MRDSGSRVVGLMLWLVAIVVWLTWAPFVPRLEQGSVQWDFPRDPTVVIGNLLLLVPLGAVIGLHLGGTVRRRVVSALAFGILVSCCIEIGQWFVQGRNVSPYDVILNAAGAGLAGYVAARTVRFDLVKPITGILVVFVFGITFVYFVSSAHVVRNVQVLEGWNPDFPILVGDEYGGGRAYDGAIANARICTNESEDNGLFCIDVGAGEEERRRLVDGVQRGQSLRVTADVLSASDHQTGPARIITFSAGAFSAGAPIRNVTLGQRGRDLVFRIQSPLSGPNASRGEFVLRHAVDSERQTRVEASFDGGIVRMSALSEDLKRHGRYYPGILQGWLLTSDAFSGSNHSFIFGLASRWASKQLQRRVPLGSPGLFTSLAAVLVVFPVAWGISWWPACRSTVHSAVAGALAGFGLVAGTDLVMSRIPPREVLVVIGLTAIVGSLFGLFDSWSASNRHDGA